MSLKAICCSIIAILSLLKPAIASRFHSVNEPNVKKIHFNPAITEISRLIKSGYIGDQKVKRTLLTASGTVKIGTLACIQNGDGWISRPDKIDTNIEIELPAVTDNYSEFLNQIKHQLESQSSKLAEQECFSNNMFITVIRIAPNGVYIGLTQDIDWKDSIEHSGYYTAVQVQNRNRELILDASVYLSPQGNNDYYSSDDAIIFKEQNAMDDYIKRYRLAKVDGNEFRVGHGNEPSIVDVPPLILISSFDQFNVKIQDAIKTLKHFWNDD